MNTVTKVAAFGLALAATFALAVGVGNAVGPVGEEPASHDTGTDHASGPEPDSRHAAADATHSEGHTGATKPRNGLADSATIPGGLMVSHNGYTLRLTDQQSAAGNGVPVEFTITGPDGEPVTDYETAHEKQLHLIAVRRDFTGFQHVHPELSTDGTWSTALDLTPGPWRLYADFTPAEADPLTLGADLHVAGDYRPAEPASVIRSAEVDGYTVTLDGDLAAGTDAKLTLTVTKDGTPVTDLQPYLGAYGHLVALRAGDLAYLHVHPDGKPGDGRTEPGPEVVFYAAVPSDGTYHLYLDFKHESVVRTAAFTINAGTGPGNAPSAGRGHEPGNDTDSAEAPAGHGH
jgi:hypothetical protein